MCIISHSTVLHFPCTEYYKFNRWFYLFHVPFSCFDKLRRCSIDEEYSSSEVGVVFLDEIYDRLGRFEAVVSMNELSIVGRSQRGREKLERVI